LQTMQKFFIGLLILTIALSLVVGPSFAAMDSQMGMDSGNTTPATNADRDSFNDLWKKAFAAGSFTADQTKRLATELETSSIKLTENYTGLNDLSQQQKKAAKGDNSTSIQKRVDLKEAERDLIVSQTKLKLEEFLSTDQVNLVLMAGFHGVSLSMSGEKHLNNTHGEMNQQMGTVEQDTMDLGKLAEKLNQNCQATTLELIRTNIGVQASM
jgi:hypothetical protein